MTRPAPGGFWTRPVRDYLRLLDCIQAGFAWWRLALLGVAAAAGWWVYVPIHELLHAFGCLLTGGEVTRLELSAEYGAAWLQGYFAWIAVGSDYAGQLTGFDTGGNDWIYVATVAAPYIITVFPGVGLLYRSLQGPWQRPWPWLVTGASLSPVLAPFISIFGDDYELASIGVSRLLSPLASVGVERWRSDDFFLLVGELWPGLGWLDALALILGLALAVTIAWLIYFAGSWLALRLWPGNAGQPGQ